MFVWFFRQLQQQQAELEVQQREGLTAYDLSQVRLFIHVHVWSACTDIRSHDGGNSIKE